MTKLLTLNIQYGQPVPVGYAIADPQLRSNGPESISLLARSIAQLAPDIVGVQEVDRGKPRSAWVDQLAVLAQHTGLQPYFARTKWHYGMGLLTRYPVHEVHVRRLPGRRSPWIPADTVHPRGRIKWPDPRACLYGIVESEGGPLALGVTHLSTVRRVALTQLDAALAHLADFAHGLPMILMGDMNLRLPYIEEALSPQLGVMPLVRANASPNWQPFFQIDHILGRGVRLIDSRVVSFPISDHAGLFVRLDEKYSCS
ncbi:endonuclease/exonuclease/phosphatase family protein [Trueperella sp. LYQ143]|uniref:endonuclease/exonuclease/phosphatase family protein n=1 Tax=unclassified Trueperella TaxID=2630174 RepID=UPI003983A9A0